MTEFKNKEFFQLFDSLDENFDAILISDLKALKYYINLTLTAGVLLITKPRAFLFVDFRYFETAKKQVKNCEVVLFSNLRKQLGSFFRQKKCSRIAVASDGMSVKSFFNYVNWFKEVEFVLSDELDRAIANQRAIKNRKEIEKIAAAQKITDWVFSEILNFIKPGVCEIEIAREINSLICKKADSIAFETIVVSGSRTSLPHGRPSSKPLEAGDLVIMDFGAVVGGYCSDMTRTVCLKNVDRFKKEVYEIVLAAQELALKEITAGVFCSDVDLKVRSYFKTFGFEKEFGHSLGHGVGLNCHEQPFLSSKSEHIIQSGAVVTVEPGLYFENNFGVRIEDMVLVQQDGIFNFTASSKNFICL